MKTLKFVAAILLVIGGLNWGLIGLFNFDLVQGLLGAWPMLVRIVYDLVGLSALLIIVKWLMKAERTA